MFLRNCVEKVADSSFQLCLTGDLVKNPRSLLVAPKMWKSSTVLTLYCLLPAGIHKFLERLHIEWTTRLHSYRARPERESGAGEGRSQEKRSAQSEGWYTYFYF